MLNLRYGINRVGAALTCVALSMAVTACSAGGDHSNAGPPAASSSTTAAPSQDSGATAPTSPVTAPGDSAGRCVNPVAEPRAKQFFLHRLSTESASLGVEAFGLLPEACRATTGVTSLPAAPKCDNIFPWIGGDVNQRRGELGAAGARLVASANIDDRLYQDLLVFDKSSPALVQLAGFAVTCGATPVPSKKNGVRRWRIAADSEKQTWFVMANGVVLYLRFDMEIGDGFTAGEIDKITHQALQVATTATSS